MCDVLFLFGCFWCLKMSQLQNKIKAEIKEDAQVIACRFPFPNWEVVDAITEGIDSVWLYRKSTS